MTMKKIDGSSLKKEEEMKENEMDGGKESEKIKPDEFRIGRIKLIRWKNLSKDGEEFYSFEIYKLYKVGGEWKSAQTFINRDLDVIRMVIDEYLRLSFPMQVSVKKENNEDL
jgi:hypothetical protein